MNLPGTDVSSILLPAYSFFYHFLKMKSKILSLTFVLILRDRKGQRNTEQWVEWGQVKASDRAVWSAET
jgi:hypothetical protein